MNIKNTIKKIGALATGGALLGATMTGALALTDLSDYPDTFIEDGEFDGQVVVGSMGTGSGIASDMVGAMNIVAQLQADSVTPVQVGGGSVDLEGGEELDEEPLNENITGVGTLDDRDLEGFQDTEVSYDGTNVDVKEQLEVTDDALQVATGLPPADRGVEEFGQSPYLTVEADQNNVVYEVLFDEDVDTSALNDDDDELTIPFAGTELEIQDVSTDSLTVSTSQEYFLEEGDTVEVDGRTVELLRVGDSSVRVEVGGQTKVISDGESKRFDDAGNFEVDVDGVFYIEGADDNGANLQLGDQITNTVSDGDSAELFGQPSQSREATFVWDLNLSTEGSDPVTQLNQSSTVGLRLNHDHTELDIREDREKAALAEGETAAFPNRHVELNFEGLDVSQYDDVTVEAVEGEKLYPEDSSGSVTIDWGYRIEAPEISAGSESGQELYVGAFSGSDGSHEVWINDGQDDVQVATGSDTTAFGSVSPTIELSDPVDILLPNDGNSSTGLTDSYFQPNGSNAADAHLRFDFDHTEAVDEELGVIVGEDNEYFGQEDDDESSDLVYIPSSGSSSNLGTTDYNFMTNYGVRIEEPESQFGSGSTFTMEVPDEEQTATVTITTDQTSRQETSSGEAYQVNRMPTGQFAVTDQNAASPGETPMITVGGPRANSVSAELLGNPSDSEINEMFNPGEGKIMLFPDENAIMVGGYAAEDTTGATQVLAQYRDFDLSGTDVTVLTEDLSDLSVVSGSQSS